MLKKAVFLSLCLGMMSVPTFKCKLKTTTKYHHKLTLVSSQTIAVDATPEPDMLQKLLSFTAHKFGWDKESNPELMSIPKPSVTVSRPIELEESCFWNNAEIASKFNAFRNGGLVSRCRSRHYIARQNETIEKAVSCLTRNDYFETRSESLISRIAVMKVVINRVKSGQFPGTICGVVYDRNNRHCQFSWVCFHNKKIKEKDEYELSRTIARFVIEYNDAIKDPSKGALYFHDRIVRKPQFTENDRNLRKVYIQPHFFYYDQSQVAEIPEK